MKFSHFLATAALCLATTAAPALAQDAAAAAVKARQAHMQLYQFNLAMLGGMARGTLDYNAERARGAAANLAALTTLNQRAYWLPNTAVGEVEGSRSLPAIWEAGSTAGDKSAAMAEAATALAAVAGDGLEALQAAMRPVGGACGDCHRAYRQRN